ncbi:MAG: DNA repair protein RecO C-terminal domain-containing protein, partial [bacterium]|nr:DNA repair protein RecO C-terminal domain-containing protein [bacterium]
RVLHAFPRVREHLDRLRVAYYILRLLREGTPERLPDVRLYDALLALLRALDHSELSVTLLFTLSADLHFLRHLGALPDAGRCTRCRQRLRAEEFAFDPRASGFLCRTCAPSLESTPHLTNAVKLLRVLLRNPVPPSRLQVPPEAVSALGELTRALLRPVHAQVGVTTSKRTVFP